MTYITQKNENNILHVYIIPNASKNEIIGIYNNLLKIKLKTSPINNAANNELISFLSKKLNIAKKNINISHGVKQKRKSISINGLSSEDIDYKLIGNPI